VASPAAVTYDFASAAPDITEEMKRESMRPATTLCLIALAAAAQADEKAETAKLYEAKCMSCHLPNGDSPQQEANFADGVWRHGSKPAEIAKSIREGVTGTAMLPFKEQLTPKEIEALAKYVRAFDKTAKKGGKESK
jgi:cytochrome c oxidase cbb3-type subunit 3